MTGLALENRRDNLSNNVIGHFDLSEASSSLRLMDRFFVNYRGCILVLTPPIRSWIDNDPVFRGYNHEINYDTSTFSHIAEIEDIIEGVDWSNQKEELAIPQAIHEIRTSQIEITIVEVEKGLPSDIDDDDLLMYID
ncbi:MAG: hypothetical protein R3F48_00865 [Candidatus Zixiibacteriota bacterium]